MTDVMTLADLTARTGMQVDEHLDLADPIPVLSGVQVQGDVAVIPADLLSGVRISGTGEPVPAAGVVLVAGQHDHRLVADEGTCVVTLNVRDRAGLAVAAFTTTAPCWLLHPEHGGMAFAPGSYVVRRQREQAEVARVVAD